MTAWLLKWYNTNWGWYNQKDTDTKKNYKEAVEKTKNNELYRQFWSFTEKAKIGDRIFLIKLGHEPEGILASGYIDSDTIHFRTKGVYVNFDKVLDYKTDNMLSLDDLKREFPDKRWNSLSLFAEYINLENIEKLEKLWVRVIDSEQNIYTSTTSQEFEEVPIDISVLKENEERKLQYAKTLSTAELKRRANKLKNENIASIATISSTYLRNQFVIEYTKRLANGYCQLCGKKAPFNDTYGNPYLETHHIIWLSKGGEDTIENTAALCPNCHRKMHVLDLKEDVEKLKCKK